MATTQEAIARLRMIFETQGATAAVAEMKKLEAAETSLGQSSLNLDRAFGNLEKRYVEGVRATAEYERAMKTLNAAVTQNPALAERAATVTAALNARYQTQMQTIKEAHQVQSAYSVGMNALSQQAQMFAASTGTAGSMLATLGRGGVAAAVGLGAVALAYHKIDEGVTNVARYARDTKQFAEATGLTTSQVQSLNKEAARFGISTDELHSGLLRFTAGFEEVRSGGGAMLEMIQKIDPALARQAVVAGSEVEALQIVGEALRRATNEFDRARLARAAFGRGGGDIALMVKNLDMGALPTRGLSQGVIDDLDKLQKEIDGRSTSIYNKIYGSFGVPWLEAKNAVLAYAEAVLKIGTTADAQKAVSGGNILRGVSELNPVLRGIVAGFVGIGEAIGFMDQKTEKAITDQERLADAFAKVQEKAKAAAPDPRGQVQFEMSRVPEGTYERQIEQIRALKAEYPGLVAQDAIRMAQLADQLRLAQAVTGAERMRAQQQAIYNQLVRQGVAPDLAALQAKRQTAIVQAQINAQAQQQLFNLQNQAGVAAAVTNAEKIRAQEVATVNALLRQGVGLETATAIAAQERANAEAQVNAQVEQQVYKLKQSTELINAQIKDMQAQAGEAHKILGINEINVRVQQALNDAIRQGADAEHASAIAAATYNNLLAQRRMQIVQAQTSGAQQGRSSAEGGEYTSAYTDAYVGGSSAPTSSSHGLLPGAGAVVQEIEAAAQAGSTLARSFLAELRGPSGGALLASSTLMEVMPAILQQAALAPILQQQQQAQEQAQEQLRSLQNQYRLGAAGTDQERAQIQRQITYEDLIKQGVSASLAQQIADQELANTMQELAKSVDANTAALQDQLDPIYSEGRAALRIGYYGEGSMGTARTVTGTGYGISPLPANTNLPAGSGSGAASTVVINNNFAAGAVLGDRRTQYQAANSYGRAISAMGT